MKDSLFRNAGGLLIGAAASLLAALTLDFIAAEPTATAALLAFALLLTIAEQIRVQRKLHALRKLGIVDWEASMSEGTTARMCIKESQKSLKFLGIAATKWIADPEAFRVMLRRHASNGGEVCFLLLHPESEACQKFETIKRQPKGDLRAKIYHNAERLKELCEGGNLQIRFYREEPRFRIVMLDDAKLILGLYSYASDSGEETPQIVFDHVRYDWTFYYGFSAFFARVWSGAQTFENLLSQRSGGE